MDVTDAIRARKSIRGYKVDPVPKEVIRDILEIATRAPSARNTQTWGIWVVRGEILKQMGDDNMALLDAGAGVTNTDISVEPYEGKYRERQNELAKQIFTAMRIAREDKEGRAKWRERAYRFFYAPALIILTVDKAVNRYQAQFQLGGLAQTICLAALERGLGTCIADAGINYVEVVRKYLPIPESERIAMTIAIGYTDPDFPA